MAFRGLISTGKHRGALALEMAMIAPAFVIIAMGIVEIGRGVMVRNIVANAAHEGARTAIINGSTNAEVTSAVQTFINSALGLAAADVSVEISALPAPGNPDPANNVVECKTGDQISVLVRIPYSRVSFMAGKYLPGGTLIGQSAMRHE